MFCQYCGNIVEERNKFCPSCGADLRASSSKNNNTTYTNTTNNSNYTENVSNQVCDDVMALIAYITWVGFIVALIMNNGDKKNDLVQFHLNQALVLNLFSLLSPIPVIGWAIGLGTFVLWIMGIISASAREKKELPLIGSIHII